MVAWELADGMNVALACCSYRGKKGCLACLRVLRVCFPSFTMRGGRTDALRQRNLLLQKVCLRLLRHKQVSPAKVDTSGSASLNSFTRNIETFGPVADNHLGAQWGYRFSALDGF